MSRKTDMVLRDKTAELPYIHENLSDFVNKVEDHSMIRFVLDLALSSIVLPPFMM